MSMIINAIKMNEETLKQEMAKGLELLNVGATIQTTLEENSKALYNVYIQIFGMAPDYKKGGKPDITGFCKKIWNAIPEAMRPRNEKGKDVPYSTAAAHLKHPLANRVRSLEKWIAAHTVELFSVEKPKLNEKGEPVVNEKTGEAVTEREFTFTAVAMDDEIKKGKALTSAIALIMADELFTTKEERERLAEILLPISQRVQPVIDAKMAEFKKAQQEKAEAFQKEQEGGAVEEAVSEVVNA